MALKVAICATLRRRGEDPALLVVTDSRAPVPVLRFPAGTVDEGEQIEDAAQCILRDETGHTGTVRMIDGEDDMSHRRAVSKTEWGGCPGPVLIFVDVDGDPALSTPRTQCTIELIQLHGLNTELHRRIAMSGNAIDDVSRSSEMLDVLEERTTSVLSICRENTSASALSVDSHLMAFAAGVAMKDASRDEYELEVTSLRLANTQLTSKVQQLTSKESTTTSNAKCDESPRGMQAELVVRNAGPRPRPQRRSRLSDFLFARCLKKRILEERRVMALTEHRPPEIIVQKKFTKVNLDSEVDLNGDADGAIDDVEPFSKEPLTPRTPEPHTPRTPTGDFTRATTPIMPYAEQFNSIMQPIMPYTEQLNINTMRQVSRASDSQPVPIVVICDPGVNVNTELAIVLLSHLHDKGHVQCKGVIANLRPQLDRARLLRGTLDVLGMHDVPVGIGTNGGSSTHRDDFSVTANHYMPPLYSERTQTMWTGHRLLATTFERAAPNSLVLTLMSSLKDAAVFLRDNEALFVSKIRIVTIMGGIDVSAFENSDSNGTQNYLVPDSSQNNEFDKSAARFFYRRCQDLGVPLNIVTRETAYAVAMPRSVYDDLAETQSPIGWRLRDAQRASLQALWCRACANSGQDPRRLSLPSRCTKKWFCDTFCGGNGLNRTEDDSMWDITTTLYMHDPIALIASVPELRERFFSSTVLRKAERVRRSSFKMLSKHGSSTELGREPGKWGEQSVIGLSSGNKGVADPTTLRAFMLDALHTSITPGGQTVNLAVCTDPGQDQDDEMMMVLLRAMQDRGHVSCIGVVANLEPARNRARLARGTLDQLGLSSVPVAIGTDGGSLTHVDTFSDTASSYMPPDDEFPATTGQELLLNLYVNAPVTGIHLLCIASLKDTALFIEEHTALFAEKTRAVTIMGGVEEFDEDDETALLVPDTAQNNVFDRAASEIVYRRCQELKVPMIIVSRHAAYRCPMPRNIYDDMAKTRHPVGVRQRDSQRSSIEHLWKRACAPEGDGRLGLPMRCDKRWFCDTFCAGQGMERDGSLSIWDLIVSFNMYDPIALLCAAPNTRYFFEPTIKRVNGVEHMVIGTSREKSGVRDDMVEELRDFLYTNFFRGITMDFSEFDGTFEAIQDSTELEERRNRNALAEKRRKLGSSDDARSMASDSTDFSDHLAVPGADHTWGQAAGSGAI